MNTEPGKTARVLVVDDHPLLRHAVQRLLETLGLVCHEADSIHDALHVVRTSRPDLVIVDSVARGRKWSRPDKPAAHAERGCRWWCFRGTSERVSVELAFMAGARAYVMKREFAQRCSMPFATR